MVQGADCSCGVVLKQMLPTCCSQRATTRTGPHSPEIGKRTGTHNNTPTQKG